MELLAGVPLGKGLIVVSNKRKATARPATSTGTFVLANIHPGMVSSYFYISLVGVLLFDQRNGQRCRGVINEWSSANVSSSRNLLVSRFLEGYDADWLIFIDSDMQFEPDAVAALLKNGDPEKSPIIGGLCFGGTQGELWPTIYGLTILDTGHPTTVRMVDYPQNAMVQVAATGAAFLAIHRSALLTIRERGFNKAFPWFQETEIADAPAGEDLTFCLRAGLSDLPVWVDTGVRIGHHKSILYTEDLYQSQQAARVAQHQEATQ